MTLANIESLWRRLVQVPGHLHLQRHEDPVEDVDEEEVGELVDPEDLRRGEVGDVVPAELQKVDTLPNFKYHQTVRGSIYYVIRDRGGGVFLIYYNIT